jgi:hypothetical protein
MLGPLRSRASWVANGLILQAVGAGGVAAYVWLKVCHQNIGGHVTAATIRLAWHGEIHTPQGLAVLAAGALIYAAGSVLTLADSGCPRRGPFKTTKTRSVPAPGGRSPSR